MEAIVTTGLAQQLVMASLTFDFLKSQPIGKLYAVTEKRSVITTLNQTCSSLILKIVEENDPQGTVLEPDTSRLKKPKPLLGLEIWASQKIKQTTLVSGGVRGTIPWMAPELLNSKKMVNEKANVYSFGMVIWELLTREELYANMKPKEIIGMPSKYKFKVSQFDGHQWYISTQINIFLMFSADIIENTLRPEIPSWCDPAWRSLMERCWSFDPDVRPSFSEIAKELRVMAASMNIK